MRTPGRLRSFAPCLWSGLVAVLLAACGQTVTEPICEPACPARTHCTETGCVADDPNGGPDLTVPTGDMAMGCVPACAGQTPYCGPGQKCVPCLVDEHCPVGQVCKPTAGTFLCLPGCGDDARCGGGSKRCCNGACFDTGSDANNCGACGNACKTPNSRSSCVGGVCTPGSCNAGWGDCNMVPADGCETNLHIDAKNCGGCGKACAIKNATAACSDGCYIAACQFGFEDCNAMDGDGCEVSVIADLNNCGGCGLKCAAVPNAKIGCVNASCQLGGCNIGYADCNGVVKDGCEVVTNSDVRNCGACGNVCAQGAVCIGGQCTCPPCNFPNAKAKCAGVQCVIDVCNQGFADCDGNSVNGCERRIDNDAANCGACGKACPMGLICAVGSCTCPQCNIPNAKSVCVNNSCVFDSCLPGFGNCDNNAGNGCEVDLRADAKNCGGCGVVCPMNAPFCTGGICNNILKSCLEYSKGGGQQSGIFTIDPDGAGPIVPFKVYCDMTMDGGGWTLALSKAVDSSNPGVNGKSLTWDCLTSSDPPQSPTDDIKTVLNFNNFAAIAPSDMMLMAGRRIIKFMYARPGGASFVNNYRYLTERSCFDAGITLDAPHTGTARSGCGHTNQACVTTDFALWKIHDQGAQGCFGESTNSHTDANYCGKSQNCGTWGNCPGGGVALPAGAPNCLFYGGNNACGFPSISNCPQQSQAPWGDYTTGTASGFYNLWIR